MARPSAARVIGAYRLIAEVGHGGTSDVYLAVARDASGPQELRVIKRLRTQLAEDPDFVEMFLDEARLALLLHHPNVVRAIEVGGEGEETYLVMEFLDGQPMQRVRSRAARRRPLTISAYVRVLCDALAGLHYAHDLKNERGEPLGIVHRDVSPHNVFLTYDGKIKILDFGVAKAKGSAHETRSGTLKGKIAYMAPEQARSLPVDRRADVFSAGAMLFEALTGRGLWDGLEETNILRRLVAGDLPDVAAAAPDAPEPLVAACRRALSVDREARYPTADAMRNALEAYLVMSGRSVSAREVGAFVGGLFSDKRAEVRAIIDAQQRSFGAGAKVRPPVRELPRYDAHSTSLLPAAPAPLPTAPAPAAPAAPFPRALLITVLIATIASIGIAVAIVEGLALMRRHKAAASAVKPVPSMQAAPDQITVTLRADPVEARLFYDGDALATNPYVIKLPRDGSTHRIRAEARGYLTKSETLMQDHDVDRTIVLDAVSP